MQSLEDDLRALPSNKKCKVGEILDRLDAGPRDALESALTNTDWTSIALTKTLYNHGYAVGVTTVKAHRSDTCACVMG